MYSPPTPTTLTTDLTKNTKAVSISKFDAQDDDNYTNDYWYYQYIINMNYKMPSLHQGIFRSSPSILSCLM